MCPCRGIYTDLDGDTNVEDTNDVMKNHIYGTLFKTQERKSNRRSKEIEQRKESQNTHKTRTCDLNLLH